jgi:hypothetical protein
VIALLRKAATESGYTRSKHIHRVRRGGKGLEGSEHRRRKSSHGAKLGFVIDELLAIRKDTVDKQVGDFLEFAMGSKVQNVVAPVMKVIPTASNRAKSRVAGGDSGESY